MNELFQPMIQIRANTAVCYNKYLGSRKKSIFKRMDSLKAEGLQNFGGKKAYSGTLSAGAIKRMRKAIDLLIESTPTRQVFSRLFNKNISHQVSFVTLTIPTNAKIELRDATKKLLEPMLRHLRQVHGMKSYVWKVELQERGQLHWHIASDVYIPHNELRNKWNALILRAGFMNEYVAREGHSNANSTDIHKVKKVKDLSAYLTKYFTKTSQNPEQLNGKLWDCSKNLKLAKYYETELTEDLEFDIFRLQQEGKCEVKQADKFTFIRFKKIKAVSVFPREVKDYYYRNLVNIYEGNFHLFPDVGKLVENQFKQEVAQDLQNIHKYQGVQLYLFNH